MDYYIVTITDDGSNVKLFNDDDQEGRFTMPEVEKLRRKFTIAKTSLSKCQKPRKLQKQPK